MLSMQRRNFFLIAFVLLFGLFALSNGQRGRAPAPAPPKPAPPPPPKPVVAPPRPVVTPPKPVVTPPKPVVTPPKPVVTPPKPVVTPPKPVVTPPKPVVTPPKPVVTPPKPVVTPPKPVVTPPKPVVTPPKPKPCPAGCAGCNAQGVCISCSANARMGGMTCECNNGFFPARSNPLVCQACDGSCRTCSGAGKDRCTSCHPGVQRNGNSCGCLRGVKKRRGLFRKKKTVYVNVCASCHGSCAGCSGEGANQCTSCPAGRILSGGQCVTCHGICASCTGPNPTQCTSCGGNSMLVPQAGGQTCQCKPGFFAAHFQPLNCQQCPKSCASCASANQCTSCIGNSIIVQNAQGRVCGCGEGTYAISQNPVNCGQCHSTCRTCSGPNANQCLTCRAAQQVLRDGTCASCHSSCQTCSGGGANQCSSCRPGAIMQATAGGMACACGAGFYTELVAGVPTCKKCDLSCKSCSGPNSNQCTDCHKGGVFNGGRCECPANQYLTSLTPFTCAACHPNCGGCSGFGANACKSCAAGYSQNGTNCFKCDPVCDTCTGPAPNQCKGCVVGAFLNVTRGGHDCKCGPMTSPQIINNKLACIPFQCAPTCGTCSGPHREQCVTCKDPTHSLINGVCRSRQCHPNCLTCSKENDAKSCTTCTTGAMLVGQDCQCKPKNYRKSSDPLVCIKCDPSCQSCDSDKCLTCPANAKRDPNSKVCTCASGFYSNPTSETLECLACHSSCKTCSNYRICTSCPLDTMHLQQGACVPCNTQCRTCSASGPNHCESCHPFAALQPVTGGKTCICQPGFVEVSKEPQVCKACAASCKTCSGTAADQCLTCENDAFFVKTLKGGECRCNAGLFLNGQGKCQKCHASCGKCNGPAATQCTECPAGQKLANNQCIKCHPTCADCDGESRTSCKSCPPHGKLLVQGNQRSCVCMEGFYSGGNDPNICHACNGMCAQCSGPAVHQCTSCPINAELVLNPTGGKTCGCQAGFYASSISPLVCSRCDSKCKTCKGAGAQNCTACHTDVVRSLVNGKCINCHGKCTSCSGEGPNSCTSCVPNAEIVVSAPGESTCKCRVGYASETEAPLRCQPYKCHPSCLTCNGPAATQCTKCPEGQELFSGQCRAPNCGDDCLRCTVGSDNKPKCIQCTAGASMVDGVCKCKEGYYRLSGGKLECAKCSEGCQACTSATQCSKCVSNSNNVTGMCMCNDGFVKSVTLGFDCARCHVKCKTCKDKSSMGCTSCSEGRVLVNGACITCSPICKTCNGQGDFKCTSAPENATLVETPEGKTVKCLPGFFSEKMDPFKCEPYKCDTSCATCFGPGPSRCSTCKDGSKLAGGACIPVICSRNCKTCNVNNPSECLTCIEGSSKDASNKCVCQDEYQTISFSPLVCEKYKCAAGCKTCTGTGADKCKTCIEGAGSPVNGTCKCSNGTYLSSKGTCLPCDSTCKSCSGANYDECTSCKDGVVLFGRKCITCDATCKVGSCNAAGPKGCTACKEGNYQLVNVDGGKACKCMAGFKGDDCSKFECDPSCKTCEGPLANQCKDCPEGRVFANKQCTKPTCDSSCLDCVGARDTDCTACPQGAELVLIDGKSGQCRAAKGFYKDVNKEKKVTFQPCHESCQTCTGGTAANCLSCKSKGVVIDGECKCEAGYFLASAKPFSCSICHPSCKTCSGDAKKCTSCPEGTQLGADGKCFTCDSTCHSCSGPNANQCTKCTSKAQLVKGANGGQGCQCPPGTFVLSNTPLTCETCDSSCATCAGGAANQCLTCPANAALNSDKSGNTCKCSEGYFAASTNPLRCIKLVCDASCAACSGPGADKCTECPQGSQLSSGKCTKIQCHTKCSSCDGPAENQCISCHANAQLKDLNGGKTCSCLSGYFASGEGASLSCAKCDSSCKQCSGNAANCTSCEGGGIVADGKCACPAGGYKISSSPFSCGTCNPGCKTCNGSTASDCLSCSEGLILEHNNCVRCDATCKKCSGSAANQCTECADNATLTEGACKCNNGFLANETAATLQCVPYSCDSTCATCTGPNKNQCRTCTAGLTKTIDGYCRNLTCHKSCSTCNGQTEFDCATCNTGAELGKDAATGKQVCQCSNGFYQTAANPLACKACDSTCGSCDAAGNCKVCPENAKANGAKCACQDGFFDTIVLSKLSCQKCPAGCSKCTGTNECTACSTDFTLANGRCIKCHSTCQKGQCKGEGPFDCLGCPANSVLTDSNGGKACNCKSGLFRDKDTGSCQLCDASCAECSGAQETQCTKCDASAVLLDGKCKCKEGTYQLSDSLGKCGKCDASCATCDGPKSSDCSGCKAPAKLITGGKCSVCDQSCETCSGPKPTECTGCRSGASLKSGKCECNEGFFVSSKDPMACAKCHSSCKTCNGVDKANCTTCSSGANLVNGACGCRAGFYQSSDFPALTCTVCDPSCATCSGSGSTACQSCPNGKTLAGGKCITCDKICKSCDGEGPSRCTECPENAEKAPSGTGNTCKCSKGYASKFPVPLKCEKYVCHPNCAECEGPEANQCTKCSGDLEFDSVNKICKPKACSPNCISCNAKNTTQCLSCAPGASLENGKCSCQAGYFQALESPLVCRPCSRKCKACNAEGSATCTACVQNSKPLNGVCTCDEGFFAGKESVFKCHRCHANCASCDGISADKCLSCPKDRKLNNGKCLKCHPVCLNCAGETDSDCIAPLPPNAELVPKGSGNTVKCKAGFYSESAGPLDCKTLICHETCSTCSGPQPNQCTKCKDEVNRTLNGGACVPKSCNTRCATCEGSGANDCLSCPFGATLTKTSGSKGSCGCSKGFTTVKAEPLTCEKIKCHRTCAECDGILATECTKCIDNSDRAIASAAHSACNCKPGTFLSSQGCDKCHETCKTCSGANYNECNSCKEGEKLIEGKCVKCHSSCSECTGPAENQCSGGCKDGTVLSIVKGGKSCSCPEGYSGAGCKNYTCTSPCKECSGPKRDQCKTCVDGFILRGTSCVKPDCAASCETCDGEGEQKCSTCKSGSALKIVSGLTGECIAKPGNYREEKSTSGSLNVVFPPCDPSCKQCNGAGAHKCTECASGAKLNENECKCSVGTFAVLSKTGLQCSTCHASCATCKGPLATDCLSCSNDNKLVGGACIKCDPACLECSGSGSSQCTSCAKGAQLTRVQNAGTEGFTCTCQIGTVGIGLSPLTCQDCDEGCTMCTVSNKCTGCDKSAVLINGKCDCAETTTKLAHKPVRCSPKCPEGCSACKGDVCTECLAGFALDGTKCTKSSCHANCLTCDGPEASQCSSCATGAEFVDDKGVRTCGCKKGYQSKVENGKMTCDRIGPCFPKCKLCSAPNDKNACVDCWRNAVLKPTGDCHCDYPDWTESVTLCSETYLDFKESADD